jgi:uncharacterized protein
MDKEYENIIKDILKNKEVMKLGETKHHDNTRLRHSLRVSFYSYKIAKKLHMNYKAIARAGVLHDFYFEQINDMSHFKDKIRMYRKEHTRVALKNSEKYFELSKLEKNIILSHMFPCNLTLPKYKESWVLSIVDKCVSTYEFINLFTKAFIVSFKYLLKLDYHKNINK